MSLGDSTSIPEGPLNTPIRYLRDKMWKFGSPWGYSIKDPEGRGQGAQVHTKIFDKFYTLIVATMVI